MTTDWIRSNIDYSLFGDVTHGAGCAMQHCSVLFQGTEKKWDIVKYDKYSVLKDF